VRSIGLVVHQQNPEAPAIGRRIVEWARGHEIAVLAVADDADDLGVAPATSLAGADVALSIGGDGTMLRTVELVAFAGVPVLGVNVGQLGYLTSVEPAHVDEALERIAAGRHSIEERMMLAAEIIRADGSDGETRWALNEVVVEKQASGHTVRLVVSFDGEPFTVYATDAMIVSTATGSTAYSLSAGGPILSPRHRALVLTPVAPHMLFNRSLVLDDGLTVGVELQGFRAADVTLDGRLLGCLAPGDRVMVQAAPEPARFVTLDGAPSFHRVVKTKFGLQDR
jgi:NAD+ kinase